MTEDTKFQLQRLIISLSYLVFENKDQIVNLSLLSATVRL